MPTILRFGPYRFFFYSADGGEPIHVHIQRDDALAKFWLQPIRLQQSEGYSRAELREISVIIEENRELLIGAWHEYFGN